MKINISSTFRRVALLVCVCAFCTQSSTAQRRIDHASLSQFPLIPEHYRVEAAGLRSLVRHASVGVTVDNGLNCLQGTKKGCTEFAPYTYDRRSWVFQIRPNEGWYKKVSEFCEHMRSSLDSFDVFSFKFCYLDGLDMIDEPCGAKVPPTPAKVEKAWLHLRDSMEAMERLAGNKTVVWWTIPLTQSGQACTDEMNSRIRSYCAEHNKWLFDIADLECHDTLGLVHRNSSGYEVAWKPFCGEQAADAQACHPNDKGSVQIAKAFWLLMARIAGWESTSSASSEQYLQIQKQHNVYPNPMGDYLHIGYSDNDLQELGDSFELVNAMGVLMRRFAPQTRIDLRDIPAGVYVLRASSRSWMFVKN